jgi:heme exporter protein CcmD
MPDLGIHVVPVLGSYAAAFVLLGGLLGLSWRAARRAKAALEEVENDG